MKQNILPNPSRTLHSFPEFNGKGYFVKLRKAYRIQQQMGIITMTSNEKLSSL